MKITSILLIIFVGAVVALTIHFSAIAYIDAPHNESNTIWCGSCHGYEIFWVGTGSYDALCQQCHTASSCPISETGTGPQAWTHSSENTSNQYGEWTWECRYCHDPHEQKQKLYKNTDADNLYLARGTIIGYIYNPPTPPESVGTSTLTYSDDGITYKDGWDATKITGKTWECRSTILFPNTNKLGYSYPVIGVDEVAETITVKGDVSPAYQYITPPSSFAVMYGQYIKDTLNNLPVKFFDKTGKNSFADGDGIYNGVCEVCHTQTAYHRNDSSGDHTHYTSETCRTCHSHLKGFRHGGGSGTGCEDCHGHEDGWLGGDYSGTTISHSTHTENEGDDVKGPNMGCSDCHDINNYPYFKSGTDGNGDGKYDLSETDVCDTCHSPGGSFNGIISQGSSIGAKTNWKDGVYQSDSTLASGKEKWCAGCHDDVPAVVNGNTAPDICGNNSSYGYYIGAHGNGTYGVNHTSRSYALGECINCHAPDNISGTSSHGGQLFATSFIDQEMGFCFKCHVDPIDSFQTSMPNQYSYSYIHGCDTDLTCPDNIRQAFTFIDTTALPKYNCSSPFAPPSSRIIDESFEGSGYQETGWTETVGSDCDLNPDYPPPSVVPGGGPESLRSISRSTGYTAYATLDYISEQSKTFTRMYIYVDSENLANGDNKTIGALRDNANNNVFISRLNQSAGQLRFNLRVYNNGGWNDYYANISQNTWYRIETKYNNKDGDPDNDTWEWRLYDSIGTLLKQDSGSLTGVHHTGIKKWNLGFMVGTQTLGGGIYFDKFAVDNNDWIGEDPTSEKGSAHFLLDVQTYMKNKWGWGSNPNPCIGCHNPHRAKKDWPCSKAKGHSNISTWEVWGDESGEKMADYVGSFGGVYQPPKKFGGGYEWSNDPNLAPNYDSLCLDCHDGIPYSTRWNRNLDQIKSLWEMTSIGGKWHGAYGNFSGGPSEKGTLKDPYEDGWTNYVLMCTDCHEPHGSENIYNLRTSVNGVTGLTVQGKFYTSGQQNPYRDQWMTWCQACHLIYNPIGHKDSGSNWGCGECHSIHD